MKKQIIQIAVLFVILIGLLYSQDLLPTVPDKPRVVKEFQVYKVKVPNKFERMEITLITQETGKAITFKNSVKDNNGRLLIGREFQGNLKPQMTDADIIWLEDFMDRMVVKARRVVK